MIQKKYAILIIAGGSPEYLTVTKHINKLIKILTSLRHDLYLLSPYDEKLIDLKKDQIWLVHTYENRLEQFVKNQFLELSFLRKIFKTQKIDIVFFAFGHDLHIIPILFSKIMGKKIILRSDGRPSLLIEKYERKHSILKKYFFRIIEFFTYHLADIVVSECEYMLKENNQDQLMNCGVANLPVDLHFFKRMMPLNQRPYDLGYFGQLQENKGVMNLIKSVSELTRRNHNVSVTVCGRGNQRDDVVRFVRDNDLEQNITLCDWIPDNNIPAYLNSIKIIVLPSVVEGLSNRILESMACGAIVLSTPVGGAPGVIVDGKTGFIMENNSVPCIVHHVSRILKDPNLENIADNAHTLIENEYSMDATLIRYQKMFEKIDS